MQLWRCSYCKAFQVGPHTPTCLACDAVGGLSGSWSYEDAVRFFLEREEKRVLELGIDVPETTKTCRVCNGEPQPNGGPPYHTCHDREERATLAAKAAGLGVALVESRMHKVYSLPQVKTQVCPECDGEGGWEVDSYAHGGGGHYTRTVGCETCGGTGRLPRSVAG